MSSITMSAPCRARVTAWARPCARAAPVTKATLPLSIPTSAPVMSWSAARWEWCPPSRRDGRRFLPDRPLQMLDLEELAIAIVAHLAPHAAEPEAAPRALGPHEAAAVERDGPRPQPLGHLVRLDRRPVDRAVQAVRGVVRDRDGLFHGLVRQQHADRAEQLFLC